MFYSKDLLARKTPLGQIWMAATKGGKISRRKLSKLNIEKICEEIMNPPVPLSLRLQGILMSGAVIVHEKKVKLLQDDLNRLVAEINDSRVLKPDATRPPKRKATKPSQRESVAFPSPAVEYVAGPSYVPMVGLDAAADAYLAENQREEQDFHQADADDITLPDGGYTSFQPDPIQLERFDDAEGNDETQADFTCEERGIPEPEQCDDRAEEEDEMNTEVIQKCAKRAKKEKAAAAATAMDDDETIIPGDVYQSWLEDPSDLRSNGGKNRKRRSKNRFSAKNMKFLMEVPQTALVQNLVDVKNGTVCYYPAPLSELWRRDSYAAAAASPPPSSAYSPERQTSPEDAFPMPVVHPTGGGGGGGGGIPDVVEPRIHTPDLFMQDSDASGREKRPSNNWIDIDPIEEDGLFQHPEEPTFELDGLTPDPVRRSPKRRASDDLQPDEVTESLKIHLKMHFDTPGTRKESLNHLASGMNRKQAASLFYHTCVLATEDYVKVLQYAAYGDIVISRGPKM